jgi:hypothetical protein
MLEYLSLEDLKKAMKKLEKEEKAVRKGSMRKYFFSAEYVSTEEVFEYLKLQTEYARQKLVKEKAECMTFLMNEEEARKAGWHDRKQDPQKLLN